jgi:hypothetical protein
METLEADGLIEWRDDDTILVMQRDDPRVVAWQVGVNEYLRAAGAASLQRSVRTDC